MKTSRVMLLLLVLVAACSRRGGGGGDDDDDGDGDADADADADADGDADSPVCDLGCPEGWQCEVGVCEGGDVDALTLDVPAVRVRGSVTLNGARPGAGPECGGCPDCAMATVAFTSEGGSGFSTYIPCSATSYPFDLDVAPGTYAVSVYGHGEDWSALPPGTALVNPSLEIDGDVSDLVLDVPAVRVRGSVTLNGARPGAGPECGGCPDCAMATVTFTSEGGSGFSTYVPCSATSYPFDLDVAPGTYAVSVYGHGEDWSALPPGTALVDSSLTVDGDVSDLVLDVPAVRVRGSVTLNGARPGAGPECGGCPDCAMATVAFTSEGGSGFSTYIPCSATSYPFDLDVAPGTYSVSVYGHGEDWSALPPGTALVDPSLEIDGDVSDLVLDVPAVRVRGSVTLNGARPGAGAECGGCPDCAMATVAFTSEGGSGFSTYIPCSATSYPFDVDVAPGTYAVSVYGHGEDWSALPPGTAVVDPSLSIDGDVSELVLDVPAVRVRGSVTLNGARPDPGPECGGCPDCAMATVSFASEGGSGFSTYIPCSATSYPFDLDVAPGTYQVSVYGHGEDWSTLPPGTTAVARRLDVR